MRRPAIVAVIALALIGIAFAVAPFHLPEPEVVPVSGLFYTGSTHCSAPIVSAFRINRNGGWFGYAPLTSAPANVRLPTCKAAARRRLDYAGMFLLAALVIAIALQRADTEASGPEPGPIGGA